MRWTVVLIGLVLAGCGGRPAPEPPANLLVGEWTLVDGDPTVCGSNLAFTTDTQTTSYPDTSRNEEHHVTFTVTRAMVQVAGGGASTQYDITGPNNVQQHGASGCRFRRT